MSKVVAIASHVVLILCDWRRDNGVEGKHKNKNYKLFNSKITWQFRKKYNHSYNKNYYFLNKFKNLIVMHTQYKIILQ